MIAFFRCVAEAVMEKGVVGLVNMVPGGPYACEVASAAWKKYKERKKDAETREEIRQLAQANFEEARKAAVEAVKAVAAAATPVEHRVALEIYLSQVPGAVRASLKRPEDATGRTVPPAFALNTPDDVLRLLPGRPPRFKPADPLPGQSGWVLVEPLGSGGFGEVWLARHKSMSSLCGAVKFCHGQQARDLKHESGLIDRVMSAGKHPNIVPLTNAHLDGDAPWLMYEYVPGGDLADLIREWQGLSAGDRLERATAALRELAAAVGVFHALAPPVVHRDLKPSNILYDRGAGKLRITDFGIGAVMAKAALAEQSRGGTTVAGRLASYLRGSHTPLYSSPQQRDGAEPDPRDDVHALGVIGYQMFTGHLSLGAGPDFADDLRDARVPEELIALLGRCVAQKLDRRPPNAGELAAWRAASAQPAPVPAPPPPATGGSYKLVLLAGHDAGKKIAVIRAVRELTGLGLAEAKLIVESLPGTVGTYPDRMSAEAAAARLTAAGGRVWVGPSHDSPPTPKPPPAAKEPQPPPAPKPPPAPPPVPKPLLVPPPPLAAKPQPPASPEVLRRNLQRWVDSGEPRRWVEYRRGQWGDIEFEGLSDALRMSKHWPLDLVEVRKALEEATRQFRTGTAPKPRPAPGRSSGKPPVPPPPPPTGFWKRLFGG